MKPTATIYDHMLPLVVAIVSALGVVMLGMGQRDLRLALVALVAIAASFILTDLKDWVRLNRMVANIAALSAVGVSIRDFMRFDADTQLLAIANLLIYLQIVLLFQEKQLRVYWQVLVLSLLEVVIGAALNLGAIFGLLLIVYMFMMQLAVILLYVRRESLDSVHSRSPTASAGGTAAFTGRRMGQPGKAGLRTRVPTPADPEGIQVLGAAGDTSRLSFRGVLRETVSAAVATLFVTAVVFYSVPRVGGAMWQPATLSFQPTVGFSGTVSLGALGASADNPEVVMRVELRDENDPTLPYTLRSDALFRGTVLNHYSRGQWQYVGPRGRAPPKELERAPPTVPAVIQRINIEPLDDRVLFGIYPFYRTIEKRYGDEVRYDTLRLRYVRPDPRRNSQFQFEVLTTGIQKGRQQSITPDTPLPLESESSERQRVLQLPYSPDAPRSVNATPQSPAPTRDGSLPIDELPTLVAAAQSQLDQAGLERGKPYFAFNAARTLELYLQMPPFRYSLLPQARDPAIDPVEDFVKNNPRGHCEYFASALALMLRSQGIPSRIVVGFKGGDYNQVGSFYQVRQLHAHAWVEAYLDPDEIPPEARPAGGLPGATAGWLTLDPTPAADDSSLFDRSGLLNIIADLGDYMKHLWSNYVVGLNAERQREAIYRPLAQFATNAEELAGGQRSVLTLLWQWLVSNALTLRGILFLIAVAFLITFVGRRLLWLVAATYRRLKRRARENIERRPVEFYERFERILARHGLRRRRQQTPLELALVAGAEMVAVAATRPDATIPRRIVEAYYRVRFGGHSLDANAAQLVEEQLARLTTVLEQSKLATLDAQPA
jgi:transglutaminase-like putative cysteine protease